MFLSSARKSVQLFFLLLLALNFAAFSAFAQSEQYHRDPAKSSSVHSGQVADVADVAKHPDQYMGKDVTVEWKIDRVYSPTTIGLEKDEHHLLVVAVPPAVLSKDQMKKDDPFTATGKIRNFDRAQLEREYGSIDFGNTPLDKFKDKPVLVVTRGRSARLGQQPAASPKALPRTASSLPALGLAGLLCVMLGFGIPLLRRSSM
jgi:hypothetical protein